MLRRRLPTFDVETAMPGSLLRAVAGCTFELRWTYGYPFAIGLMAAVCLGLYVVFKRRDWL